MARLLLSVFALIVSYILYKTLYLVKNVIAARKTGLPYMISPLHELEAWAFHVNAWTRQHYHDSLMRDEGWPRFLRFMVKDWMYEDKFRAHDELGDVFLVVSPGGMICYMADPTMITDVCSRRRDFVKPIEKMKMIEPYGPNIVTTEGDIWRRHVRVVAPPLTDAVNRSVWIEAHRQSDLLVDKWISRGFSALKTDIPGVALNVMCFALFGKQYEQKRQNGRSLTLIESITGVIRHLPQFLLYPRWSLPYIGAEAGYNAFHEFQDYITEFIDGEKKRQKTDGEHNVAKGKETLLGALVRTNDADAKLLQQGNHQEKQRRDQQPLSQEHLTGNMFMLIAAGYDTTANTIIYTAINLVLYPEIQQAAIAEVDRIYDEAAKDGRRELAYELDFGKFRYLLGLMFETLRVFPIVIPIARTTLQQQSVTMSTPRHGSNGETASTSTVVLPADCGVITNIPGVHNNPSVWPNPHIFEPKRWLVKEPNAYDPMDISSTEKQPQVDGTPTTSSARKGTFMTFGEGARACLGRRFAQSEYVAFFSHILRNYTLELDAGQDRNFVETSLRCRSAASTMTLVAPDDVRIKLVPRQGKQ